VSLIQLSKFDEALKFIEKSKQSQVLIFEKAYCEYRINRPEVAFMTIESANLNPLPANLKELKAQVYYRLEQYDESFNLYKEIVKNSHDEYEEERTTNLSAVVANLSIEGTVSVPTHSPLQETHYLIVFRTRSFPIWAKTPMNSSTIMLAP